MQEHDTDVVKKEILSRIMYFNKIIIPAYRLDIVSSLILVPIRSGLSTSRRPRLLPLYIKNILNGISAKESAQILCPAFYSVYD